MLSADLIKSLFGEKHADGVQIRQLQGVADCMLGRGDDAWRTSVKVVPDNLENPVSQSAASRSHLQNTKTAGDSWDILFFNRSNIVFAFCSSKYSLKT